jgi:hypothetical protein
VFFLSVANNSNNTTASPSITSTFSNTQVSPVTCPGTSIFEPNQIQLYEGLSTAPAQQCQCLTSLRSWLADPNAPTRTLTRLIGTDVTTLTQTVGGTPTVITSAVIETSVVTVSTNFIGTNHFDGKILWYGSATAPCVCFIYHHRLKYRKLDPSNMSGVCSAIVALSLLPL